VGIRHKVENKAEAYSVPPLNILDVVHREEILLNDARHACVKINRGDLDPLGA